MADRRQFLRGLATLPLIGGSVAILGKPTQAAVPVTIDLIQSYQAWLHYEHRMLAYEMAGYDVRLAQGIEGCTHMNNLGADYHFGWPSRGRPLAGWPDARNPRPARPWCSALSGARWQEVATMAEPVFDRLGARACSSN